MGPRNSAAIESTERELVITRVLDAPRRLVFKAWTEPERVVRWWGPQGFTMPSCQMDVRQGGAFRFCMRSPDGTDHWLQGFYREIVEPERLVLTWAWEDAEGKPGHETQVEVGFAEHGAKTKLTRHPGGVESITGPGSRPGGGTSRM